MRHFPVAIAVIVTLLAPRVADGQTTTRSVDGPRIQRILKYIPDDAKVVVMVPALDDLVAGLRAFGKTIRVEDLADLNVRDLLEEAVGEGVAAMDTAGPLILVVAAGRDEPLLIAAAAGPQAWKSQTQPSRLGPDAWLVEFGPQHGLAASVGDVIIFGREKADLRGALDSTGRHAARLGQEVGQLLERGQIVVYVDVPAWKEELDTQLELVSQALSVGMTLAGPEAEMGVRVCSWLLERARTVLAETESCVSTLRIDGRGVFADFRAAFKAEGQVAGYLGQVQRPRRDLLRGLRAGDGPLVFAFEWVDGPGVEGLNSALTRAILSAESLKAQVEAERLEGFLKKSLEVHRRMSGTNAAFSLVPDGQGLLYWGLYLTNEGEAVRSDLRGICETTTPELMSAWGAFPIGIGSRESERIGPVEADAYQFDFSQARQPMQPMLAALYGKNPTFYMAPHPEGVAYTFGPRSQARDKLQVLVTGQEAPLSADPRVVELFRILRPDPQFCLLMDIPGTVKCFAGLLEHFGVPIPPLAPGDRKLPLAGFTMYLEPRAVRAELFVPAEPLTALIKLAEGLERHDEAY